MPAAAKAEAIASAVSMTFAPAAKASALTASPAFAPAIGSSVVKSTFDGSPSAARTFCSAAATVSPAEACRPLIRVVRGSMMVEPEGASSCPLNANPVEMSVPPKAMSGPLPPVSVKLPLESVVVDASLDASWPVPLSSAKTVAPEM